MATPNTWVLSKCPNCNGTGHADRLITKCGHCNGKRETLREVPDPFYTVPHLIALRESVQG